MENKSIMFICGKCGNEVGKEDTVCKKCGAKLGKIRCPFCHFTGTASDFKNDKCPRCGKNNKLSNPLNIKNKIITKKSNFYNNETIEPENFISKYFIYIFSALSLLIFILLVIFLKNFSLI